MKETAVIIPYILVPRIFGTVKNVGRWSLGMRLITPLNTRSCKRNCAKLALCKNVG